MSARSEKIGEEIKKELGRIISEEMNDPRIKGIISVTKVKASEDLDYAKAYISVLGADKKEVLKSLKTASGFIRKLVAKNVDLRNTPEILFELDESMEYGEHISNILKDVMKDVKPD